MRVEDSGYLTAMVRLPPFDFQASALGASVWPPKDRWRPETVLAPEAAAAAARAGEEARRTMEVGVEAHTRNARLNTRRIPA